MDRPRFSDHLEAIKFICKDFWSELFKKQIDNLKTNHRVCFIPPIVHLVAIVGDGYGGFIIFTFLSFAGYICIAG